MNSSQQQAQVQVVEVPPSREGQRLDNFLLARLSGVPKSLIYRVIRKGQVRVNGKRAKPFQKLDAGDQVRIPPVRHKVSSPASVPAEVVGSLEQRLVFENDDFLVCDKPAGLAVHAGSGVRWGVVDAWRQARPGSDIDLVHRLDRETSGLLVMGKNGEALRHLQQQFRERKTRKRYFALLHGRMPEDRMRVDQPLAKTQRGGERYMKVGAGGKPAITEFTRLENYPEATFVEAMPVTGRTHQIRVHAQFLGTPCVGDPRYLPEGSQEFWRRKGLQRLFLHAHALEFEDLAGERQQLSCPLPDELRALLDRR